MAGDSPLAVAWIEVRTTGRHFRDDLKREAEQAGRDAGNAAERGFEKAYDPDPGKRLRDQRGRFVRAADELGQAAGTKAGTAAGESMSRTMADRLRDDRGRFVSAWGAVIGQQAGVNAGRSFSATLQTYGKKAGDGLGSDLSKGIDGAFSRSLLGGQGILGKLTSIPGIALTTSSVGALGSALQATAGAAVTLSGAVAVLPAVALSAAAGIGALKLATSGVSDAIAAIGTDAFAEKLKVLAPAAQAFVLQVKALKPELRGLRNEVQGEFFKGMAAEFEKLAGATLPLLGKRLGEVSGAFGSGLIDVSQLVRSREGIELIDRVLNETATSSRSLAGAMKPLAASLLDIADVGSQFLPAGAERLADAAARFQSKVAEMKANGDLEGLVRDGLDAFSDLGRVVENTGKIIGGIFRAGSGDTSGLDSLANVLGKISTEVNSPAFQRGLGDVFAAVARGSEAIGEAMPDVADALVALAPAIGSIAEGSGKAFADILHDIAGIAQDLAPSLNAVGGVLEHLAPVAGEVTIAYLGIKGAMLGVQAVGKATAFIDILTGKWALLNKELAGTAVSSKHATAAAAATTGFTGTLGRLGGAALAVGAFAELTRGMTSYVNTTRVGQVETSALAKDLASFGKTGEFTGSAKMLFEPGFAARLASGWDWFGTKIDTSADALNAFSSAARSTYGDFFGAGFLRAVKNAGSELDGFTEKQDEALTSLVKTGQIGAAGAAYARLSKILQDNGASVEDVKSKYPQYQSALADVAAAAGTTVDKLSDSTAAMILNAQKASELLGTRSGARGLEQAIDDATAALKANGRTLDITTAKGRANESALDQIASSGLAAAAGYRKLGQDGNVDTTLDNTSDALVDLATKMLGSKSAAIDLTSQLLGIPSPEIRLRANIGDLDDKIAAAKKKLRDKNLTDPQKAKIRADIADLLAKKRRAQAAIDALHGKTVTLDLVERLRRIGAPALAGEKSRLEQYLNDRRSTGGKIPGFAAGGFTGKIPLQWGGSTADSITARSPKGLLALSGNEFVVRAAVVQQPGMEAHLTALNNSYVSGYAAGGGLARRASAGLGDLTASKPARIAAAAQPAIHQQPEPARLHPDDIDALGAAFGRAVKGMRINVGEQELGRIVNRALGQQL